MNIPEIETGLYFWDSSAILPLLVKEDNSEFILNIYKKHPSLIVWWACEIECVSALARLEREQKINSGHMASAMHRLKLLKEHWHEVLPNDIVKELAKRMLRVHTLRAADAQQLAAADFLTERKTWDVGFVCLDKKLNEAAQKEGIFTVCEAR